MSKQNLDELQQSLINGDNDSTLAAVDAALQAGWDPLTIINDGCQPAMDKVGEMFYTGEAFLPDLVRAGRAMSAAMDALLPSLQAGQSEDLQRGRMVLGTVQSDLHDIGKSLVQTMVSVGGFKVTDLGVNVPAKKILETAQAVDADIIGTSSLLTTSMFYQGELLRYATDAGLRDRFFFIIGGGSVTPEFAREIGADGYARSAAGATELCQTLVSGSARPPLAKPIIVDR
jgi:methylmalonyl-CoA mutase cobalamin-binding domain/chain